MRLRWRRDRLLGGRHHAAELGKLPMFNACSGSKLRFLDSLMCEIDVAAGRVLVREDQHAEQMLVVLGGRARVSRHNETLGFADRGALVRGRALGDRTDSVTMTADTPMTVRAAGPREMRTILDAMPGLEAGSWGAPSDHIGLADEAEAYLEPSTKEPERVSAARMFPAIVRTSGMLSAQ